MEIFSVKYVIYTRIYSLWVHVSENNKIWTVYRVTRKDAYPYSEKVNVVGAHLFGSPCTTSTGCRSRSRSKYCTYSSQCCTCCLFRIWYIVHCGILQGSLANTYSLQCCNIYLEFDTLWLFTLSPRKNCDIVYDHIF